MSGQRVELLPSGRTLEVPAGAGLQDLLFGEGVEFPCGGRGRCRGCRVRVLEGRLPVTESDRALLPPRDLEEGWRLACQARVAGDLKLELAQWEAAILSDDSKFEFRPRPGYGIAVDLGTTTVVAQLLDLSTASVLGVRTALNPQARHGADIMTRIDFALHDPSATLTRDVRAQVGAMVLALLEAASLPGEALREVVLCGNSAMHHLFCGIDVAPLSQHPFEPVTPGTVLHAASDLGWSLPASCRVRFLPCLGGFVGSDILTGILATGLHRRPRLEALVDLGTNGEIVVGNQDRLLCASTAAGPAFEGARISMGMRAATGAIASVTLDQGELRCQVLGDVEPRGLCGSGLVDAVAAGLDQGWIEPSGRMRSTSRVLAGRVSLHQCDVRELQLAKGAIAAGLRLLARQWGADVEDIERVHLAGAFGNYINRASARRIGLLPVAPDRVLASGNTALRGAKIALFDPVSDGESHADLLSRVHHVSLNEDAAFQDVYVAEMGFPGAPA